MESIVVVSLRETTRLSRSERATITPKPTASYY
jgi:hypothetical protein